MPARESLRKRQVPAPGEAAMPAANAAALIRSNAEDPARADGPAIKFADRVWTHAEFYAESRRFAGQRSLARDAVARR